MAAERAFGLAKCKFRVLEGVILEQVTDYASMIKACCVLHNFILLQGDPPVERDANVPVPHVNILGAAVGGHPKREAIMEYLMTENHQY